MKKIVQSLLLAGVASVVIVSCQTKSTPPAVVPELSGEIQLSVPSARVGAGQIVSASYTLPAEAPQNVLSSTYSWYMPGNKGDDAVIGADKTATVKFTASETLGADKIRFVANYKPADLTSEVIKEKVLDFTVVACDVATSFFGDSKEMVINTSPVALAVDGQGLKYDFIPGVIYGERASATRRYLFADNKLSKVIETEEVTHSASSPNNVMNVFLARLAVWTTLREATFKEFYTIDVQTQVKTNRTLDGFEGNDALINSIAQDIEAKKVEVVAVVESGNIKVTFTEKILQGSVWGFTEEYLPK